MKQVRHWLTLTLLAMFLWGLAGCLWYALYLMARLRIVSFFFTFGVLPVPFVLDWWLLRSGWLARISASPWGRRMRPLLMFTRRAMIWFLGAVLLFLAIPRLAVASDVKKYTFRFAEAPPRPVAIVFGAGVLPDGRLTLILRERVETAARLYLEGKVQKLLMSGDNRFVDYNEPAAMRAHALHLGVPEEAIVLDYAGRSTYDTCYRAVVIFDVRAAILVTQDYHLPRALYTCHTLGMDAAGVTALRNTQYRRLPPIFANVRESLATWNALLELHVSHPIPVLGKPEPIFPPVGG